MPTQAWSMAPDGSSRRLETNMRLGYNTNGMAHHELFDAVTLLAEIGYRSVAITIDHAALAPGEKYLAQRLTRLRRLLDGFGMRSVIETGARYLLDPKKKHEPTLITANPAGRARRIAFYKHAIDCAAALGSDCVSLWSGVLHDATDDHRAVDRLVEGLSEVLDYGAGQGVAIGLEPEPGMLIDSMARYESLLRHLDTPNLRLTLDIGHLHCQGEVPIARVVERWAPRLVNVHIEDMRSGVHEHLRFGQGEIDFPPVLRALADAGYQGGVHVELSRHSHEAPEAAKQAFEFLQPLVAERP
ncbi:MAG TPA: sugar phosphate isomerase/epimerase family protein [Thermoguttaceae bacterium]|nr:sugar phosphate isomerase/epimerase family protein [Thermoguttaceae bacterium]